MAIDRFWLTQVSQDPSMLPVLRFYTWQPAALSVGFHQSIDPTWSDLIERHQLNLVRRPSGGRAVLHQGDLCYAIVSPILFKGRSQNYNYLCQFLLQGLGSLYRDLAPQSSAGSFSLGTGGREYIDQSNCFATATGTDLVFNLPNQVPLKLVGSAQTYTSRAVLQHGSILIKPNPHLWQDFWGFTPWGLADLFPGLSLEQLTQLLIKYLCDGAIAAWQISLIEQELNPTELESINFET